MHIYICYISNFLRILDNLLYLSIVYTARQEKVCKYDFTSATRYFDTTLKNNKFVAFVSIPNNFLNI